MTENKTSQEDLLHRLHIDEWVKISSELTYSEVKVYYYLVLSGKSGEKARVYGVKAIAQAMSMSIGAVSEAIKELRAKGLLPDWVLLHQANGLESEIRDRLQSQLGGLREVKTPAGRIDLLTETEIIEVKNIKDWKAAMGQVLAYSGFYPEHRKRLHLFGKKGEMVSSTAVTICAELGITVTFEEVE